MIYGKHITITGEVKYIGDGENPEDNIVFKAWKKAFIDFHNQPERLNPEESKFYSEFGCSMPISFNTSDGMKTMMPGKRYDENLNEIGLCDSPNSANK